MINDDNLRGRYRGARRDFTNKTVHPLPATPIAPPLQQPSIEPRKRRKFRKRAYLLILLVLIGIGVGTNLFLRSKINSPVPKDVQRSVSFPIYYPDSKRLPAGYTFDSASLKTPVSNGVLYSVDYGNKKKIVFSLQPKPTDVQLKTFTNNYIPLRNEISTKVGKAQIGFYTNHSVTQTLVSLPTDSNTWLIISAPYDINHEQLKAVLNSLKK